MEKKKNDGEEVKRKAAACGGTCKNEPSMQNKTTKNKIKKKQKKNDLAVNEREHFKVTFE